MSSAPGPGMPPNVILIVADQQRADALGCAGHPVLRTPHLDRLAARGVRFTRAFAASPLCMPMRASLVSGLYPHNHAMWANNGALPAEDETFMHLLQRAGYFAAHIGKGHYYDWRSLRHLREREDYVRARGFDLVHETTGPAFARTIDSYMTDDLERRGLLERFRAGYGRGRGEARERHPWDVIPCPVSPDDHLDSYIGRTAAEFVAGYGEPRPFYLFLGFGGPHDPWDAPGEYAEMYDPQSVPERIPAAEPGPWVPEPAARRMREGRARDIDEAGTRRMRANYYGKISLIDHWVGRVLDAVERRGWTEHTLVVFTSDHGEMAGDHDRFHKTVFYEASVRVPLIASWPGHTADGATAAGLVESNDLFPTILEAAGAPPSARALGRSLWPALRAPETRVRDDVLSEVRAHTADRRLTTMLRTESHKYALDSTGEGFLLHDLDADPDEQVNLAGHPDHRALEAELRDRLLRRLAQAQWQR